MTANNKKTQQSKQAPPKAVEQTTEKIEKVEKGEVKAAGAVSRDDYFKAHLPLFYRRPTTIMILILGIIVLIDLYFRSTYMRSETTTIFWVVAVVTVIGAYFGLPFGLKFQIGKLYDKNDFYGSKLKYSINPKGVAITGKLNGKRYKWEEFKRIRKFKAYYAFEIDNLHIVVLPIRFLTPEQVPVLDDTIVKQTTGKKVKVKVA